MEEKVYWFKSLNKGSWSWGLPLVWQGWVAWLLFGIVNFVSLIYVEPLNEIWHWIVFGTSIFLIILVHFIKGEPPKNRFT
ncbi:hypothetical protein HII17_03380 [Thalassotalea sp. M1531]|uniref:DUF4175 domain-containing protein n=1 Tax=Thalassotalea algicola TaxID=2716224 RepID=A0A7Y0L9S4_9GAMM|nr:hypothetical protein [Thalassotalea algicola]NMP30594.1 hypothetical protein [Thalassotalea algicola]